MIQDWKVCYRMQCVAPCRIWDEDVCKSLRSRLVLEHRFLRFLISSVLINAFKCNECIWKSKGDVTLLYNGKLIFCTKKEISIKKINLAFQNFSQKNKILEITKEKLVSVDFNHNSSSSIVDASLTNVVGKNMGKISAWYDNEWGFSNRMCDIAEYLHKIS